MENLMSRYRNVTFLVAILFVQVLGLAVQVKRSGAGEHTRVIRLWTVSAVSPLEKALLWFQNGVGNIWSNYVYLRGVRQENRDLKFEIERLRLEQVRLSDDAQQARRLQALLGFRETYIAKTVAAQVIGTSGSEQSRSIYIDKGTSAGVDKDMAVITADGLVGKVLRAFGSTSQVLLINDQSSGVGVILDKTRLQGVIKGTAAGEVILEKVMTDEQVSARRPDRNQRRRSDISQGHYCRNGDEGFTGGRPLPEHTSQTVGQPEPAGRSVGNHEERGSAAVRCGQQFSPRGRHPDPAAAFGTRQAGSGHDSGTRYDQAGGRGPETPGAGGGKHSSRTFDRASGKASDLADSSCAEKSFADGQAGSVGTGTSTGRVSTGFFAAQHRGSTSLACLLPTHRRSRWRYTGSIPSQPFWFRWARCFYKLFCPGISISFFSSTCRCWS